MRIDGSRVGRLALAGALAGLVIFAVFNPGIVRDEAKIPQINLETMLDIDKMLNLYEDLKKIVQTPDPFGAFMFTGAFAAMVGGMLVIADDTSASLKRIVKKCLLAAALGTAVGGTTGVLIDFVSTRLMRLSFFFILLVQPLGWLLIGIGAGAGIGLALGSWRRMKTCMIGGLIGGFVGGSVFDIIGSTTGMITANGSIGRLFGFPIMGLIIGVSVAFIEEVAKRSWVTVLNGSKEGRNYILSKPVTTIGRDELADISLFADPKVMKHHADLMLNGYIVTLNAADGEVEVNGAGTKSAQLRPWDVFTVGRYQLRFHQKGDKRLSPYQSPYAQPQYPQQMPPPPQPVYAPPARTVVQPMMMAATGNISLLVVSGPHTNTVYQFGPGAIRIGREVGCAINLSMDTVVSRIHAEIVWTGSAWVARDLKSTNGLWVNGVRTMEHTLNLGDQIGIGQTWLRVQGV